MDNATRPDQHEGAERAIRSKAAAEDYLASHPEANLIWELRAYWQTEKNAKVRAPSPARRVKRAVRLARELLQEVGNKHALGQPLRRFLAEAEQRDPVLVEWKRRLAAAPLDERFALLLSIHAFSLFRDGRHPTRFVSGRLAAVLATAEGVTKPSARSRKTSDSDDAAHQTIRAWEAAMSRAARTVWRWRRDEVG